MSLRYQTFGQRDTQGFIAGDDRKIKRRIRHREWCQRNKERVNAKQREYRQKNTEMVRKWKREAYRRNIDKMQEIDRMRYYAKRRFEHMLRRYGITEGEWHRILKSQNYQCRICKKVFNLESKLRRERPCVDHCHTTGRVRGILCQGCNVAIGAMGDSPHVAFAAADYLFREKL